MATNKLKKVGYGQLEPNRLTAQKTKEVYAQLTADASLKVIEQGMALVYDQSEGKVRTSTSAGSDIVCLVMNEILLEDERYQEDKDYAQFNRTEETAYQLPVLAVPRLYGLHIGDTFTTNTVKIEDTYKDGVKVPEKTPFTADTDGYWVQIDAEAAKTAKVVATLVKDYTVPDMQRGLKLVVTKVADSALATASV